MFEKIVNPFVLLISWYIFRPVNKTFEKIQSKLEEERDESTRKEFKDYQNRVDSVKAILNMGESGEAQRMLRELVEDVSAKAEPTTPTEANLRIVSLLVLKRALITLQGKIH